MAAGTSIVLQPGVIPGTAPAAPQLLDVPDADMVAFLRRCLLDPRMPIALWWRAILTLRNRKDAGSRLALVVAMADESALLAHKAAFSLGQMQDPESIPGLRATLLGIQEFHPIVRHEEEKEQLHERYAALFGLRSRGDPDDVAAIIASLKYESALLKHEVAFALGLLQDKAPQMR